MNKMLLSSLTTKYNHLVKILLTYLSWEVSGVASYYANLFLVALALVMALSTLL